ncbi:PaaI family thioesterase [Micromonospora sp. NBC_01699]|uniref:PaaI family thioesterase n=1 Tax=Micromonospora sp. NBC_01699 TaxID=2975984 RepID=UPI002E2F5E9B|nr:PaaI family thioesterase [Micromonospora sp. NBC_01699]
MITAGARRARPGGAAVEFSELTGGFAGLLGLRLDEATAERVVITWDCRPDLHQPYGIQHGGVYSSVVETAGSIGGAIWWGARGRVVGVSNQTDFLRAVREGELTAVATPVHQGRSQQLWQVDITDAEGRLAARGQVRLQNLTPAPPAR